MYLYHINFFLELSPHFILFASTPFLCFILSPQSGISISGPVAPMFPQKKPSNALAAKMVGNEVPKPGHEDGTPKGLDRVVTVY